MNNTKEKQKLIDKYIGRIKTDYPEDDKLMIDLEQFAQEIVKLCNLPDVSGMLPTCTNCGNKMKVYAYECKCGMTKLAE